jgi:hypothetical protein
MSRYSREQCAKVKDKFLAPEIIFRCQSGANFRFCSFARSDKCPIYLCGDVAEWLKAAVC